MSLLSSKINGSHHPIALGKVFKGPPKITNLVYTAGPASTPGFPKGSHDLSVFFTYSFFAEGFLRSAQFPLAQLPPIFLEHFKGHLFQEAHADFPGRSDLQPALSMYLTLVPCIRDKAEILLLFKI